MFRQAAVQDAAQLPGSGYLFLNLHASEMANDDIIETMRKIKAIAPPQWQLVLEINENAVADLPTWKSWREQLKAMGMLIAYDDFGMGQSRVIELTELPPDFIKLDMQLVRNLHLVKARQDFIQALTQVSGKLGVKVIAEGIEFPKEAQICRKMGCDFGQGFLFAPPQGPPSRIPHFGEQVPDLSASDMERRAAVRLPGYGMTLVRPGTGDARKIPAHAAKIVNFSAAGIAILLNQQLDPETQLELAPIGWTGSCSILKAVVVHARKKDDNWVHGCKFTTNLSKADLEKLTAYQIKHSR
jgi:EAL domain-containing protein (putative c-di-GMP-specific phosphodiesterase class I)